MLPFADVETLFPDFFRNSDAFKTYWGNMACMGMHGNMYHVQYFNHTIVSYSYPKSLNINSSLWHELLLWV